MFVTLAATIVMTLVLYACGSGDAIESGAESTVSMTTEAATAIVSSMTVYTVPPTTGIASSTTAAADG